ncbi:MAG: peptide ABC transporter substrate-binding protein [Okeania sp. SIO2C9]|uniref:ABC transporter substrate-binding protein n=1 Tax=Okeania sp. SIO2C9 TaxID=2607791 RepID=UPI0013C13D8E|nr:ABC transporter substrate-binding protein [Okeania sp. SIO2C9]NEQ73606.1 peptide ABC transporter substrate-binding protein [Okeania sp. SIO2C9]
MVKHQLFNSVNRSRQLIIQFISLFCLCCFLVISCSQPQNNPNNTSTTEIKTNRITIGTTLKPRTVDPADAYEVISGNLLYNLGDRLYGYKLGTTELVPQLATEMPKISEDGTEYTIPLRQGVTFHDGTPFNSEAMAFSLKRFIENEGPPSSLLANTVESVEATGEYQLTIKLKKPFAAFTPLLAFSGLCAVSPQAYTTDENKFKPDTFIGTGPYKLAEYGTDVLRLDIFENYWGEKPQNKGVDIQIFSSSANLFNAFKTGAIDVAYLSLDTDQIYNLEQESERQGWQVISTDGKTVNYIVLNLNSAPLDNKAVRQALAAIVDRNLLNKRVLRGQSEPIYSLIPNKFAGYKPVFQENYGDGNFDKAKELLKEAGYSQDNPAKIEIWYASNSTKRQLVASTLKASVEEKIDGLMELELNSVEAATAFKNLDKGLYQTFMLDWYGDFVDADNYIQPFLECTKGSEETGCEAGASQFQGSFYYSDRINQLIEQQRQEQNPEKRQGIFREIQDLLGEDVPFIPLWLDKDYVFAQKNINGVSLEPTQQFPFWTINKS